MALWTHPVRMWTQSHFYQFPYGSPKNKGAFSQKNIAKNKAVIPSQCAHWRGNLPDFQSFLVYPGDCHTSDLGHWFAMTAFLFVLSLMRQLLYLFLWEIPWICIPSAQLLVKHKDMNRQEEDQRDGNHTVEC